MLINLVNEIANLLLRKMRVTRAFHAGKCARSPFLSLSLSGALSKCNFPLTCIDLAMEFRAAASFCSQRRLSISVLFAVHHAKIIPSTNNFPPRLLFSSTLRYTFYQKRSRYIFCQKLNEGRDEQEGNRRGYREMRR